MLTFLMISVASITFSLLCYLSIFILNRKAGIFNGKQMIVLIVGISADILGTAMMYSLSTEVKFDLHTISGYLALSLMLAMGLFASYALLKKNQTILKNFGHYYFPVLIIWILSYVTGVVVGLQKIS